MGAPQTDTPDEFGPPTLQERSNSEMRWQLGGVDPVDIHTITSTHPPIDGVFADLLSLAMLKLIPSTSDTTWLAINETSALQSFKIDRVLDGHSSGLVWVRRNLSGCHVPLGTDPSVWVLSSFLLPAMPPELRIPLSHLGEDRLQVQISDSAATDMDMKSHVLE